MGLEKRAARVTVRRQVDWGGRTGFARLAIRLQIPIVPVAALGVDLQYLGLNDGYRWGKRLHVPNRLPFYIAFGLVGLFPLSIPFPTHIRQRIGMPISVAGLTENDAEDLAARVVRAVQDLLDS